MDSGGPSLFQSISMLCSNVPYPTDGSSGCLLVSGMICHKKILFTNPCICSAPPHDVKVFAHASFITQNWQVNESGISGVRLPSVNILL